MVWLNSNNVRDLRTPFGGVKASGLGHEGGYRSIDFYTHQQAVHVTLGECAQPDLRRGSRRRPSGIEARTLMSANPITPADPSPS